MRSQGGVVITSDLWLAGTLTDEGVAAAACVLVSRVLTQEGVVITCYVALAGLFTKKGVTHAGVVIRAAVGSKERI